MLLHAGQLVVVGYVHELLELGEAFEGGGFGVGDFHFVVVEVVKHLLEGDGVVGHEGEEVVFRGAFGRAGFLDCVAVGFVSI